MEQPIKILTNMFNDGSSIPSIELGLMTEEERIYHESEFEHFQYVFTKDNMSTYHQQFDNILHWIWNEYDNDPKVYESIEYKTKICDKVFTTINARVFGILNPDDNHAEIMNILGRVVPDVNMIEYVANQRSKLYDRKTPFTKEDAVVWYRIGTPSITRDASFANKQLPIPYIKINDRIIEFDNNMQDFYLAIFRYAIRWYNHLYSTKNESIWKKIDDNEHIFASLSNKKSDFKYADETDNVDEIIKMNNFHKISDFNLDVGELIVINISSENGQFHDKVMQPYCFAFLARRDDGYWISSQRGYDMWYISNKYDLLSSRWEKKWINTLTARNKNEEAVLTEMWQDVMQSNAVLFPADNRIPIEIKLRITNWNKYNIQSLLDQSDTVDLCDDIAYVTIHNINTLVDIWKILEHTLDLWIRYGINIDWSLICNIYRNQYQMYIDKPHIITGNVTENITFNPKEDVIAVVPRNGMSVYIVEEKVNRIFTPKSFNGIQMRKSYL